MSAPKTLKEAIDKLAANKMRLDRARFVIDELGGALERCVTLLSVELNHADDRTDPRSESIAAAIEGAQAPLKMARLRRWIV